ISGVPRRTDADPTSLVLDPAACRSRTDHGRVDGFRPSRDGSSPRGEARVIPAGAARLPRCWSIQDCAAHPCRSRREETPPPFACSGGGVILTEGGRPMMKKPPHPGVFIREEILDALGLSIARNWINENRNRGDASSGRVAGRTG